MILFLFVMVFGVRREGFDETLKSGDLCFMNSSGEKNCKYCPSGGVTTMTTKRNECLTACGLYTDNVDRAACEKCSTNKSGDNSGGYVCM